MQRRLAAQMGIDFGCSTQGPRNDHAAARGVAKQLDKMPLFSLQSLMWIMAVTGRFLNSPEVASQILTRAVRIWRVTCWRVHHDHTFDCVVCTPVSPTCKRVFDTRPFPLHVHVPAPGAMPDGTMVRADQFWCCLICCSFAADLAS